MSSRFCSLGGLGCPAETPLRDPRGGRCFTVLSMRRVATPPLGLDRHDARSGASITADVGHSVSLVLFVYILHMAARCGADKVLFSLGGSGATEGRRKEDAAFRTFSPLCQNTQVQQDTKFQSPSSRCSGDPPFPTPTYRLLRGVITPLPKNKTETIGRSVGCGTGFWQKGTVHGGGRAAEGRAA